MEMYYGQELPPRVLEILASEDDEMIVSQDLSYTDFLEYKQEIPRIVNTLCKGGQSAIFATDNVVIVVMRKTAWLCSFDTKIHKDASARDVVKAYKEFIVMLKEKTLYKKAESRTPLKRFAEVFAKASNSKIEGVCSKSFSTKDGEMVDEYIVGIVLERSTPCL